MKIRSGHARGAQQGIMLVECLVYLSVFFVLSGVAGACFYRALEATRQLHRQTATIVQVMDAGERWRADVRQAVAAPTVAVEGEAQLLRIPTAEGGEVDYHFFAGQLFRRGAVDRNWARILSGLRSTSFQASDRGGVPAWRWDLEVSSSLKQVRLRPIFSFQAVVGGFSAVAANSVQPPKDR